MHAKTDSWILMKEEGNILIFGKRIFLFIVLTLLGGFITGVIAQPNPPRPVILTANNSFPLAFGAFSPGAGGGTVIISPGGTRTSTGDVVLLNLGYAYSSAMFYIRANPRLCDLTYDHLSGYSDTRWRRFIDTKFRRHTAGVTICHHFTMAATDHPAGWRHTHHRSYRIKSGGTI